MAWRPHEEADTGPAGVPGGPGGVRRRQSRLKVCAGAAVRLESGALNLHQCGPRPGAPGYPEETVRVQLLVAEDERDLDGALDLARRAPSGFSSAPPYSRTAPRTASRADVARHSPGARVTKDHVANGSLRGASLPGADLSGLDLTDQDLRGADLRGADLHRVNLTRARMEGAPYSQEPTSLAPALTARF